MTTLVRALPPASTLFRGNSVRPSRVNWPLLIAIAILSAVLIADAVIIAVAPPSFAELGSFYVTTT